MMLTIPFAYRHFYINIYEIIQANNSKNTNQIINTERPEEILLNDKGIQLSLIGLFLLVCN